MCWGDLHWGVTKAHTRVAHVRAYCYEPWFWKEVVAAKDTFQRCDLHSKPNYERGNANEYFETLISV